MSQSFFYPPSSTNTVSISAIGSNGATSPVTSLQVAGKDNLGNLQPLAVSTAGIVSVSVQNTTLAVTQSGAWTVGQSGTWNITNISGTISLPTGAATSALQTTANTSLASIDTKLTSPLSVAQSGVWNVGQSGTWNITNVSGTVSLPTGAATAALQTTANTSLASIDTKLTAPLSTQAVVSSTATLTNVAGSATSVQLLAANASRKQAMFFNDSTALLYLKFGTTASATSFTVQLPANAYYELPQVGIYTGRIDGIWASAAGNVRITEMT